MKWNIKKPNVLKVAAYKNRLGISSLFARVFLNRGIALDAADKLLHDPLALIEDPYEIVHAELAARTILQMLHQKKQFYVFADYDVDGITSGYIMTDFLRSIGEAAMAYYPERREGYGLSMAFAEAVVREENAVVITVDNGITKVDEVAFLQAHGIPVIVTDHHEPQAGLPDCPCCDPHISETGAGSHLCGAGVAWKICMILEDLLHKGSSEKYLPYVALGTVADVMPMTQENAAIVNLGLAAINRGNSRTIHALMDALDIKELTAEDIAWKIAPKLNACGRMGDVHTAGDFFFLEDEPMEYIKDQILEILEADDARQKATKSAQKAIEKLDYNGDMVCLFDASEYPAGIGGIIAGKIAERFGKPAFVYSDDGGDVVGGSARSAGGIDLSGLLENERRKGTIASWGGHALACGVTIYADRLDDFRMGMNQQISSLLEQGLLETKEPELAIDAEIGFGDFTTDVLNELEQMPYDKAVCPAPVFCMRGLHVRAKQPYSNKNHLVLDCTDKNGAQFTLVEWNGYPAYEALGMPTVIDIAGTLSTVGFHDRTTGRKAQDVTIRIADMRATVD